MILNRMFSHKQINDNMMLCQNYINLLYNDPQVQRIHIDKSKNSITESSGEIFFPSVQTLLSCIPLNEKDVFIDYGSGAGKIVLQVFLSSVVKEAYGIEIIPEWHRQATHVAMRVKRELPEFFERGRQLTFLQGDFLKQPIETATVALICSTCFTQPMLHQLGKMIEKTPSIHTVLTLRPFFSLQRLRFRRVVRIECSWDSALCYIYR